MADSDIQNSSALSEQHELIFTDGKYIGVRPYYNFFINLYLLDDVFYEVWYSPEENKIEKIEELDDTKKLNLYIDFMKKMEDPDVKK